ncbi:unnamed protein product [Closterium sp. NIES-64]|nr:unnamed protein product [Closterium sp. NIES-64]
MASVSTSAKDDVKAFNLEKFSGEDRGSWSFRMELLFNHYGLLEVMDGEVKRPASEGATKEWDRRSKDGFFLLSQCLSSNQLHHIKHLIKELSAAGVDYPEKIKCYKALSLLPESWGPLVVNLNGMKDSWSLEWIRAHVLQEEFRRKELTAAAGEGGGSAYGMKGFKGRGSKKGKAKEGSGGEQHSGGKRGNKGGKQRGGKCWYCHVEGHPWFKCRKLPDGWRPGQPSLEGSKGVHRAMGEGVGSEEGDGGAEGEATEVEGVLQKEEAPVAERGDAGEEVQQPTSSPSLPPRRTTQGKRGAVRGGAKEGAAKERPKRAAHPRDFLKDRE